MTDLFWNIISKQLVYYVNSQIKEKLPFTRTEHI